MGPPASRTSQSANFLSSSTHDQGPSSTPARTGFSTVPPPASVLLERLKARSFSRAPGTIKILLLIRLLSQLQLQLEQRLSPVRNRHKVHTFEASREFKTVLVVD